MPVNFTDTASETSALFHGMFRLLQLLVDSGKLSGPHARDVVEAMLEGAAIDVTQPEPAERTRALINRLAHQNLHGR